MLVGKGRATRYARARTVEGLGRQVPVFRVDEAGAASSLGVLHLLWEGQHWWERPGYSEVFVGLPPAFADMAPQGYLGHGFPPRFPELGLPPRTTDWSDDHRLIALARRGEDCVGDVIVGDESLARFLEAAPHDADRPEFPRLALQSARELPGSSAGGERPKFGVFSRGRHVLVKFAPAADAGAAARRWRDLLWCEWKALQLVAAARIPAASAECVDVEGWRFLEVERSTASALAAVVECSASARSTTNTLVSETAGRPRLRGSPATPGSSSLTRTHGGCGGWTRSAS